MTETHTLEVRKDNLEQTRVAVADGPNLQAGEILCRIDCFALTANNITYGVVGEKIGYWQFFPADEGWGVIPVWGFAEVLESHHPKVAVGERLYGYFPMGSHLVMRPVAVTPERLIDGSAHRAALPPVYNSYSRTAAEPHFDPDMDQERMLLMPLFATSYCLYDFLKDNGWFGAQQVIILSASSKTAIGLAMALDDDASSPPVIALTSARNSAWVQSLDLYQQVHNYDDLLELDATLPTVIVDMSGNGKIVSDLHAHLGNNMRHCCNVGITHYDATGMGPGFIAERSAFFFAPSHIQKRGDDWGPGVFQQKAFVFWQQAALKSRAWLQLDQFTGTEGMQTAYLNVLGGEIRPDQGVIVQLWK